MNDQLTPHIVVHGLLELARELAVLSKDLDAIEIDAVNKRENLTLAAAKAFLSADGPVETRKNIALVATHTERLAAETAEAVVKGRKRQIETLRIRIDVGRSAAAALRAEMALS
jgi:hypothetical protein